MLVRPVAAKWVRKASSGAATPAATAGNPLGIFVEDIDDAQRRQLGIDGDDGVVVTRIAGTAARRTALAPGDVILMIGRKPIRSAADFNGTLKSAKPGDSVMLLVRRDEQTQFIALTVQGATLRDVPELVALAIPR